MLQYFSFKKTLQFVFITIAAAVASAPYALADGQTFDLTSFNGANAQPVVQPQTAYGGGGVVASAGEQVSQQTPQQNYVPNVANRTSNQRLPLAIATRTVLSQRSQQLPQTNLDSFVYQAGGMADQIYGDEGDTDIPPFMGMDGSHTIGSGINSNLTTGHASDLPGAWTTYY